ncbi:hypothetical protein [Conexibacter arvalis]|uniref:Uncharacterized protein n=1 Tax=Conexibacter arvalis TaxID=912552 RepID=A0A840I9F9_9ACTN|nr:hypothetical protein [Conexibacter arvalis]MBB4660738.1 hypothetical protein [Conexibacter arvalis]
MSNLAASTVVAARRSARASSSVSLSEAQPPNAIIAHASRQPSVNVPNPVTLASLPLLMQRLGDDLKACEQNMARKPIG